MTRKRTKPAVNKGKSRYNICLDADTKIRAEQLEITEQRSFSNLLSVLINREFVRLFPNGKEKESA